MARLCSRQYTVAQIADMFHVSRQTIDRLRPVLPGLRGRLIGVDARLAADGVQRTDAPPHQRGRDVGDPAFVIHHVYSAILVGALLWPVRVRAGERLFVLWADLAPGLDGGDEQFPVPVGFPRPLAVPRPDMASGTINIDVQSADSCTSR